jgi:hypothetical protein
MDHAPGNSLLRILRRAARRNLRRRHPQSLAIENQNHWVRDVTLAEDASRIRINPGIMARLRSQTLNIARANGVTNIAKALWAAALDPEISLSYTGL